MKAFSFRVWIVKKENKFKLFIILSIILLFLLVSGSCLKWLVKDQEPLIWDQFSYYEISLLYSKDLFKSEINIDYPLGHVENYKPPLIPFLSAVLYQVFWTSQDIAKIPNLFFFAILLFALTASEVSIKKGWNAGIYSPFLLLLIPTIIKENLQYWPDFAAIAFAALGFLLLLKFEYFGTYKTSMLLGIIIGLGQLVRVNFFISLIGPSIFLYFCRFRNRGLSEVIFGAILLSLITTIICGPWYLLNFKSIFALYSSSMFGEVGIEAMGMNGGFFTNLEVYLNLIFGSLKWLVILFLISAAIIWRSRKILDKNEKSEIIALGLFFIIPIIFYSGLINIQLRYVYPVYIPIVIISSIGIEKLIRSHILNRIFTLALIVLCAFSIFSYINNLEHRTWNTMDFQEYVNDNYSNFSLYIASNHFPFGLCFGFYEDYYLQKGNIKSVYCSKLSHSLLEFQKIEGPKIVILTRNNPLFLEEHQPGFLIERTKQFLLVNATLNDAEKKKKIMSFTLESVPVEVFQIG